MLYTGETYTVYAAGIIEIYDPLRSRGTIVK
jgi:hypothetical protein